MSAALEPSDFPAFFEAVRGRCPFLWQSRFVEQVVAAEGWRWPPLVDLPTGAGKTALLDIAVFLLALDAVHGGGRASRRTVLVVDRRVVVDQAAVAARDLRDALAAPAAWRRAGSDHQRAVLGSVAGALRGLSRQGPALNVGTLRGGLVRDETWARRPDVPAVLSSTVDQVGSRLLFRGYGISEEMRPIHAGLLGTDTLLLLDEVHLAQPFAQTLGVIAARYQAQAEATLPARWQVVELSATPATRTAGAFHLIDEDLDPVASPVLWRRVNASKPTRLRAVKSRTNDRGTLAAACAAAAREHLKRAGVATVAVVVNRVATAQSVRELLGDLHAVLLTGRMRPLDRDRVVAGVLARLETGHDRPAGAEPLVVVGTQSIEAGADFDFDALVTECASLDALRQRFGRLDRAGALAERGTPAEGLVLAREVDIAPGADDPVYGGALARTWQWLEDAAALDFGVAHLALPDDGTLPTLLAPRPDAPLLFPAHLDAWAQTWPTPQYDPDVALWLHGLRPASTDVAIVWRADLTEQFLRSGHEARPQDGEASPAFDEVLTLAAACPPASVEAVQVPIAAARRWLAEEPAQGETADVDAPEAEPDTESQQARPFVRWRGERSEIEVRPARLRPGDVVVVPAAYGGLRHESWDPWSPDPVPDLGDTAQLRARTRLVLRLVPALWPDIGVPCPAEDAGPREDRAAVREWLQAKAAGLPDARGEAATRLLTHFSRARVSRVRGPAFDPAAPEPVALWFVCSGIAPPPLAQGPRPEADLAPDADSDPETSAFTGAPQPVTLDAHLDGVADWARDLARRCGLDDDLVGDLALAARLHDVGKADPRFQLWLHGGDEVAMAGASEEIAKSGLATTDRAARRRARERSGYPEGARHELLSVALIQDQADLAAQAHDWDLVLHLVASHHGFTRPFGPVIADPDPRAVALAVGGLVLEGRSDHGLERLDSGLSDRFWRLVRRYGWFRLAWLEALLRLADHNRSAEEQEATA